MPSQLSFAIFFLLGLRLASSSNSPQPKSLTSVTKEHRENIKMLYSLYYSNHIFGGSSFPSPPPSDTFREISFFYLATKAREEILYFYENFSFLQSLDLRIFSKSQDEKRSLSLHANLTNFSAVDLFEHEKGFRLREIFGAEVDGFNLKTA